MKIDSFYSFAVITLLCSSMTLGCGADTRSGDPGSDRTLVAISLMPADPSIANNGDIRFTATGTFSDSTTQDLTTAVTWTSSDSDSVFIANAPGSEGFASARFPGKVTITAAYGGLSASTTVEVQSATLTSIAIIPGNQSITEGTTQQYSAIGTFSDATSLDLTSSVRWSTSDPGVAVISNAAGVKGLATAVSPGSAMIFALSAGVSGTASVTVTPVSTGSVTLQWTAPTMNVDGSPLTDLLGFKIYYGTSTGSYTKSVDVGNSTTYAINDLPPGAYYFAVTSYNTSLIESDYSAEIARNIP